MGLTLHYLAVVPLLLLVIEVPKQPNVDPECFVEPFLGG